MILCASWTISIIATFSNENLYVVCNREVLTLYIGYKVRLDAQYREKDISFAGLNDSLFTASLL
jgi:hypothetical protein